MVKSCLIKYHLCTGRHFMRTKRYNSITYDAITSHNVYYWPRFIGFAEVRASEQAQGQPAEQKPFFPQRILRVQHLHTAAQKPDHISRSRRILGRDRYSCRRGLIGAWRSVHRLRLAVSLGHSHFLNLVNVLRDQAIQQWTTWQPAFQFVVNTSMTVNVKKSLILIFFNCNVKQRLTTQMGDALQNFTFSRAADIQQPASQSAALRSLNWPAARVGT